MQKIHDEQNVTILNKDKSGLYPPPKKKKIENGTWVLLMVPLLQGLGWWWALARSLVS